MYAFIFLDFVGLVLYVLCLYMQICIVYYFCPYLYHCFIHPSTQILPFILYLFCYIFFFFPYFFSFSLWADVACICLFYAAYLPWLTCVRAASAGGLLCTLSRRYAQRSFFFCVFFKYPFFPLHCSVQMPHTHTRNRCRSSAGSAGRPTDTLHTHSTRRNTAAPECRDMNAAAADARERDTHDHTHTPWCNTRSKADYFGRHTQATQHKMHVLAAHTETLRICWFCTHSTQTRPRTHNLCLCFLCLWRRCLFFLLFIISAFASPVQKSSTHTHHTHEEDCTFKESTCTHTAQEWLRSSRRRLCRVCWVCPQCTHLLHSHTRSCSASRSSSAMPSSSHTTTVFPFECVLSLLTQCPQYLAERMREREKTERFYCFQHAFDNHIYTAPFVLTSTEVACTHATHAEPVWWRIYSLCATDEKQSCEYCIVAYTQRTQSHKREREP